MIKLNYGTVQHIHASIKYYANISYFMYIAYKIPSKNKLTNKLLFACMESFINIIQTYLKLIIKFLCRKRNINIITLSA